MSNLIPVLAHGALGPWDEIIFIGVMVIFFVMMGLSWLRSRDMEPEWDDDQPRQRTVATEPDADRFELD